MLSHSLRNTVPIFNKFQLTTKTANEYRDKYFNVHRQYEDLKAEREAMQEGSVETLRKTQTELMSYIDELKEKAERFSDFELLEMKRAYEQQDLKNSQIMQLQSELVANRREINRLMNSRMELEQEKAQVDLLRTLNQHLREELDNHKRMLESSVGDICPALMSIDIEEENETSQRFRERSDKLAHQTKNLSLYDIVQQVRSYAANVEHLYYSEKDVRAFIASLAASHLLILQGMSGTGKTSLPRVFAKAIFGEVDIVPVESSWRDRNELLGYYNDFSKKFTAKEFTCCLYRAGLPGYSEMPYFIVLDEMNLSRVEYYFADFLSILEDKPSNWKVRLVDTDMRQLPNQINKAVKKAIEEDENTQKDQLLALVNRLYPANCDYKLDETEKVSSSDKLQLITYLANQQNKFSDGKGSLVGGPAHLINGNTIRIPKNVWFIGTANRDESTFEITDKVYDRAQVINFNERSTAFQENEYRKQFRITFENLIREFEQCNHNDPFKADSDTLLSEIEDKLKRHFGIAFGNRIQDQIQKFVPVYVAAGPKDYREELIIEAIDYQITNKVLRKLEYAEIDKELAEELKQFFENNFMPMAKMFMDKKIRN